MVDVRKILVVIVIAVLYSVFVITVIEAFYPSPDYDDYCRDTRPVVPRKLSHNCSDFEAPEVAWDDCDKDDGVIQYKYDAYGCAYDYECNFCQKDWKDARKGYTLIVFIISAVMGLAAVAAGFYIPVAKNRINEWIASGFILGGLTSLFIGTIRHYEYMQRFVRPIVILFEMVLIIFLTYKKLRNKK